MDGIVSNLTQALSTVWNCRLLHVIGPNILEVELFAVATSLNGCNGSVIMLHDAVG